MHIALPNPLGAPFILDTSSLLPRPRSYSLRWRSRVLLAILALALFFFLWPSPPLPPSYTREWDVERRLLQHNRDLPPPEGRNGRYIKFDVPNSGTRSSTLDLSFPSISPDIHPATLSPLLTSDIAGQIQHALLHHHVALSTNRSFAFDPITLSPSLLPIIWNEWPWRTARIPLGAVASTAINGFEKLTKRPRAVSAKHYASVCARRERVYTIRSAAYPDGEVELARGGRERMERLERLLAVDDSCVRIRGDVFAPDFLDSAEAMDMVHQLTQSPALQHFSFGPTALEIVNRAIPVIARGTEHYNFALVSKAHGKGAPHTSKWKHILALQIPHSDDWEAECKALAKRSSPFTAFNKLPGFPGNENVPPPDDMTEPSRLGLYTAKCLPDITTTISRARRMRKNHPLLRTIYVITDGSAEWAEELRKWLLSDGWDAVFVGKLDVHAAWADQDLGPVVDMEVARRSGVFVGNGFTTMASIIALLRTRDHVHPDFTQFW